MLDKGVYIRRELPMLLYADDIVLMANGVKDLQCMLDVLGDWCKNRVLMLTCIVCQRVEI